MPAIFAALLIVAFIFFRSVFGAGGWTPALFAAGALVAIGFMLSRAFHRHRLRD